MKIIVIGGGIYGISIAEKLIQEKHDITIIDKDPVCIEQISSSLDALAIVGSGADITILDKANIKNADMLLAVTDSDEVNMVSCMIAKYCGVKIKIARLSNIDSEIVPGDMKDFFNEAGIDFVVNPESACAREFEAIILSSGIIEEISFHGNSIVLVSCRIGKNANMKNVLLKELKSEAILRGIRFVSIIRDDKVIIPRGDDQVFEKDIVYFMCEKKMVKDVLSWLDVPNHFPERVIIHGASKVGVRLAQFLETHKIDVKVIEEDSKKASYASEILRKTMVFNGEPTDESLLESMDIADVDAFVSASYDDESNILACVLAKQMLSKKTYAFIRKSEYAEIVSSVMKVNRVINPKKVTVNSILKFIRKGNVASVNSLHELDAEVMEMVVDSDAKVVGKKIMDLNFPSDAIIGAIVKKGKMVFATGDYVIESGDHVLIFLFSSAIAKVESIFAKKLFRIF